MNTPASRLYASEKATVDAFGIDVDDTPEVDA